MAKLNTVEDLRRVLPPPKARTSSKILDHLDEQGIGFLAASPFALLSTTAPDGTIEVSPKGDVPGFIHVETTRQVLIPERAGNNLAFGLQNILANGRIGLIALSPGTGETLRFSGLAEILDDPDLLERLSAPKRPALLALRVRFERAYFHCARSVLRAGLWDAQTWPEPRKISFGRIIAPHLPTGGATVAEIDEAVAGSYGTRLWANGELARASRPRTRSDPGSSSPLQLDPGSAVGRPGKWRSARRYSGSPR